MTILQPKIPRFIVLIFLLFFSAAVFYSGAQAQRRGQRSGKEESLSLDLQKIQLGSISGVEERKRYMVTIQLEKQRIQNQLLRSVYDNAFELYKNGEFEKSQEMAGKILSIDPNFQDAALLVNASGQLKGSRSAGVSKKMMIDDKFRQGLIFYQEGRRVEAAAVWNEVVKLSPGNLKAKYWLKKTNEEIARSHIKKGRDAYERQDFKEAVDRFYSALMLMPNDRQIVDMINKAEGQLRGQEVNNRLRTALDLYGQGRLNEAYDTLMKIQQIQPGEPKTAKLLGEVKSEIAGKYISEGRKLYGMRKYNEAIEKWSYAPNYGADPAYIQKLSARAGEQMRREATAKRRQMDRKRRQTEAARKRRDEKEAESLKNKEQSEKSQGAPKTITEEHKRAAQQHYLEGLKYFQNSNLEKARDEWIIAKQLDPGHADADAGLKRIEQMFSSGQ